MAHPSPSPSGSSSSSSRRLSEVLGEQQEPFSLDLYLLERGCSQAAFLDATACGGGACSTCWPKTRGTTGRTLRMPARNTKGSRRSGVLRMLLSKILSGTTAPAAAATKQNRQQRAAVEWRRVVAEKQRTQDSFELAVPSSSPGAGAGAGAGAVEAHMEDDDEEQEDDDEEDESSKKQLSPVSVLEQRLFEQSSPPPPHEPKALGIFVELLEAAYTPNTLLLDDVLAMAARHRSSSTQSRDGRRRSISTDSSTPTRTPRARRKKKKKHNTRRKEDVAFEKDLGTVTCPVATEMAAGARVRAGDLRPSVVDVGVLIAAAVLETLTEETAAELMGIDRGCAVDTARWCGRC